SERLADIASPDSRRDSRGVQRSGDRHQPTSQQSSHRNHGHNNDRHGTDRRGGGDKYRSNNNYSGNNNRNAGNGRDQRNRGQQSNRCANSGYDGLPMVPEDPYAYVKAAMPEQPLPDFIPQSVYLEFVPPEDDVLQVEDQSLPTAVSPTLDSPGYITESDLEEEDDEDPKDDPVNYPTDRDDDEEKESFGDDVDD
nr:hypothetical protein [Tanacetum cinerariifolium]